MRFPFIINQDTCQQVSISGTNAKSNAITEVEAYIWATVDCFAKTGADPTATASGTGNIPIPAYTVMPIPLDTGAPTGNKVGIITSGATGTAYILPGRSVGGQA